MKRGAAALAWLVVALTAFGLHPALREGTPLADLGRHIAEDAALGGRLLPSGGDQLALWALVLSLAYLAGWGLFLLCPRRPEAEPAEVPLPLIAAAILGQVAAAVARDPTGLYFILGGAAALSIRRPQRSGSASRRAIPAFGLGIVLIVLASAVDAELARLAGRPVLPEAWFPLYVEFSSRPLVGAVLALVVAASCFALTRIRVSWIALAPACVLILGPSNPAKGLAAAAVGALLARAGAGPIARFSFLLLSIAIMVAAAFAL